MTESTKIAYLIERLGNLLRVDERSSGAEYGLQVVHVQVLNYLSLCNRYSDTPAGVTSFLGATKGTVSQSINVLERKGLITKTPDTEDGRVVHLNLTDAGKQLIDDKFSKPDILAELDDMRYGDRQSLVGLLTGLLTDLQHRNGGRLFGECRTCRHFRKDGFEDTHQCGLTLEPLSDDESLKICREHELAARSERRV